jgi:hypothetical protein
VVAQFLALATDIYTEEQGRRLFPIIRRRQLRG